MATRVTPQLYRLAIFLIVLLGGCAPFQRQPDIVQTTPTAPRPSVPERAERSFLRHLLNTSAAPDIEIVSLPPIFQLAPATPGAGHPGDWLIVSSASAKTTPQGTEPWVFDLSPFLGIDPFLGPWNPPLPTDQHVFVKRSEAARVEVDRDSWNERFVVELAVNSLEEPKRGTSQAERLAFEDPARVLCHKGVTRQTLSSTAIEAIYESKFSACPQFGPDRVVLTRDLVGNWDSLRHSQGIFSFSYESKGDRLTPAQRVEGMKLIQAARLVMATQDGEKHRIWRDEQLRLVNSQ